ncbi:MAG: Asp23/Gls24 family envelope stress response protein [Actinomycetota bacterium]|nr:Asp23/Gls24 family envelope stress response protein [Actinomycetota bacterium]
MTDLPGRARADDVADVVRSVPGVADLHPGTFGEVATYLPGRRVVGVRLRDDVTEVHVVLRFGAPVLLTAEAIRLAVRPLVDTPVNVAVEDVVGH